jgi:hypothetical protein
MGCFILDLLKIHVMYKEIYITTASVDLHTLTVWFIPCGEYYKEQSPLFPPILFTWFMFAPQTFLGSLNPPKLSLMVYVTSLI